MKEEDRFGTLAHIEKIPIKTSKLRLKGMGVDVMVSKAYGRSKTKNFSYIQCKVCIICIDQ